MNRYVRDIVENAYKEGKHKYRSNDDYKFSSLVNSEMDSLAKYTLYQMVISEMFFDLYISFKQKDVRFKSDKDIDLMIDKILTKYSRFIRNSVWNFSQNLSKLTRKSLKAKWKINKTKRIPTIQEPIKISFDIRYAVLKMFDFKCSECLTPASDNSIDVYQVSNITENTVNLLPYCNVCKEKNIAVILQEPKNENNE